MKIIAMIPARYEASRFSGKLMKDLEGKPVIVRTFEAVLNTKLFGQVYVVTDDNRIEEAILNVGGKVIRSKKEHKSGSDRIAEACENLEADVIVNIQGDEPFTEKKNLEMLLKIFSEDVNNEVSVASLMERLDNPEEVCNPNNVKVVVSKNGDALYFSRAFIPFPRDEKSEGVYFKHIGIYAYRKEALMQFTQLEESILEKTEKLEQLRYLENGFRIRLAETNISTIGIDTEEDLQKARQLWKKRNHL
ncbi:3-deoxy-manno-octulosonate cytidylyltransferase [Capnocytophaga felis]|uniref:3-deoxy-manno-octulosonate cytidylyltransferase n=1 Tax=Capnocytophaga felis TaxID=2267611 RepID=A0A5M4B825_9FLAO|nr:3-deoxy-manno-octulosonate cytidylyltransferase [Capnocytophaga felis]GET45678.1 3-deoxy-manno-octulosonate cytidylyltransferase [Capnocytophaga felis]GET47902.1 3-deoxy-manno-octulosonate cytidylyltransferase [Capnocytophaga felis]